MRAHPTGLCHLLVRGLVVIHVLAFEALWTNVKVTFFAADHQIRLKFSAVVAADLLFHAICLLG